MYFIHLIIITSLTLYFIQYYCHIKNKKTKLNYMTSDNYFRVTHLLANFYYFCIVFCFLLNSLSFSVQNIIIPHFYHSSDNNCCLIVFFFCIRKEINSIKFLLLKIKKNGTQLIRLEIKIQKLRCVCCLAQ